MPLIDDLERFATDFRLFSLGLFILGLFLIFINYYNVQWKELKIESKPREKQNGLQINLLLGLAISFIGFIGFFSSCYYLMGIEVTGFVEYEDGNPISGVEIDIPKVNPGYTNNVGYYILHNVPRNQSYLFVKVNEKIIHREPTKFSQYMLGLSSSQNITVKLLPLWIHGNLRNEYGDPLHEKIIRLKCNEKDMNVTTDLQGNFDFGKILVHHKPIGLQPMILSARSTDETLERILTPIDISLEEPYEIDQSMIWDERDKLVIIGVVKSAGDIKNLEDLMVKMNKSHCFINSTGYYILQKVPITTNEWLVTTPNGTILDNGTIYPELTFEENPAYRPLYIE